MIALVITRAVLYWLVSSFLITLLLSYLLKHDVASQKIYKLSLKTILVRCEITQGTPILILVNMVKESDYW